MIAFNSGGALTAASSVFNAHASGNPFLPAPLLADTSDGYGAWKSTGEDSNQVALKFSRFLFAGAQKPHRHFTPGLSHGQYVGINTVEAVGTPHGNSLTGSFTNHFVNIGGTVVFSGNGTFSAQRLTP